MCISLFKKERCTFYIAECLRMITENTAKSVGGSYITARLEDIFYPQPVEEKSADDIIGGIRRKIDTMRGG